MVCCNQNGCLVLPTTGAGEIDFTTQVILFQGTNQNQFQNFVGATGKASDVVSYTMAHSGNVTGFAAAINGVNFQKTYTFYICVDVPVGTVGVPLVVNQLAKVEITMNQSVTGTMLTTSRSSEEGIPHQARASTKDSIPLPYIPINAYATWTTIKPGAVILRDQIVSLYLDTNLTNEEACFQVFVVSETE